MHVTLRVAPHVWNLRTKRCFKPLRAALRDGADRFGFRLVHYSVQRDHLHLMAEADDAQALARGVKGLCIRIARRLNRVMERQGAVFTDRYHARVLRTPSEVRRALCYVLNNIKKHTAQQGYTGRTREVDPFSTAGSFDGWARSIVLRPPPWMEDRRGVAPRSWMLREGWRRAGPIDPTEIPSFSSEASRT